VTNACNIAFKEWAMVVDALGRGRQIVILRKGGIIEDKGAFTVDHSQFWLFPTLYHQQMESVVPEAQEDFGQLKARFPAGDAVSLQYLAKVEKAVEITDPARLRPLRGQHIWKESVIEERFGYGKNNGIHLILARVYALPTPVTLPMQPGYGGCKSWVELERALPTTDLIPCLTDDEFETKAVQVLAAL
jgi:hypothetical protein